MRVSLEAVGEVRLGAPDGGRSADGGFKYVSHNQHYVNLRVVQTRAIPA
jgi:hypothetical protein